MRFAIFFCAFFSLAGANAATLRIINAMPVAGGVSAPSVDVYVDGFPLVSRLGYGQVVSLASAPQGMRSFSVRSYPGGQVLVERTLIFNPAAPLGHFLALAGDDRARPHALIAWQRESVPIYEPPGGLGLTIPGVTADRQTIHLATTLGPTVELSQRHWRAVPGPSFSGGGGGVFEFPYGIPSGAGYSRSTGAQIYEVSAIDTTQGLFQLRLPVLEVGEYLLNFFLIGNGEARTPFEWIALDHTQVIARGPGSYLTQPILTGKHYFAVAGRPGSGLYLEPVDDGERLVGFVFGIGGDLRSTWQLLDGSRIGSGQYRLEAKTAAPDGDIGEQWTLHFRSCNEVEVTHYRGTRVIESSEILRTAPLGSCTEYSPQ